MLVKLVCQFTGRLDQFAFEFDSLVAFHWGLAVDAFDKLEEFSRVCSGSKA